MIRSPVGKRRTKPRRPRVCVPFDHLFVVGALYVAYRAGRSL